MGAIIGMLVGKSIFGHVIGEKLARMLAIGGLFLLVLSVLGTAKCAYDSSIIRKHEQGVQLKQVKRERKADANLQVQKGRDEAASQQRREEIDNATQGIPDQAISARQRARVCIELRRQAAKRGTSEPAC